MLLFMKLIFETVATFIVWGTIEFVHIRFRNALKVQGQSVDELPFKAKWYPYGTYAALAANVFLVFFQGENKISCLLRPQLPILTLMLKGYTAFLNPFDSTAFVTNYILLPVFVILLVGYKFWKKTKWVTLEGMDIWTGRREAPVDDEESGTKKNSMLYKIRNTVVG